MHPSSKAERQQGIHKADLLFPAVSKDTRRFETNPFDSRLTEARQTYIANV